MALAYHPRAPYLNEVVMGYHGTSRVAARRIVDSQTFKVSDTPDEWLGRGAYFFQGSIHRAREWASNRHRDPAVVSARIRLGHCVDLLDNPWMVPLKAIAVELRTSSGGTTQALLTNRGLRHSLDCAAVNRLCEDWKPDTVRATYHEGEPVDADSEFATLQHIQLAVRDPKTSIFDVRHEGY